MTTNIKNWETMSNTGRYLTAQDTLNEEGYFTQVKGSVLNGLVLVVGFVTKYELLHIKSTFPDIVIVETL